MKVRLLCILAVLCVIGCQEHLYDTSAPTESAPIHLAGSITQQNVTRANEQGFVSGDRMGVYIVDYKQDQPGMLHATDNRASNLAFTFDADNYRWTAPTAVYWRDKETPVDIYAYYPLANYIANPSAYAFEVQADQSIEAQNGDLATYEQSDLLWGKQTGVSPTSETIIVKMQHQLAGVRVYLNRGEGISDTEWAKLSPIVLIENTIRQATVDLSTGTATVAGGQGAVPINMAPQSDNSYRAVVVPQIVSAGQTLLSVTIDGTSYSHQLSTAMIYQAGKLHNFTLTVNKSELTGDYAISVVNNGITPWVNDENSHQFSSQTYVIVHCDSIGTLKECITKAGLDYKTVQNLKVTGYLTDADFALLRDEMPELRHLNLKDVHTRHIQISHEFYDSNWHSGYADSVMGSLRGANHIRSLVLPASLKALGREVLSGMRGLMYSTLEIPEGVTKIGVLALAYNEEMNGVELILPSTLDSIETSAFYACGYSCELKLTDNITFIGGGAFDRTPNFHGTFHIPSKLKQIDGAFNGLGSDGSFVGEIEIPQGITSVSGALGIAMAKRVALTLPPGVKTIGRGWPSRGFTSIKFNDDLEEIGASCFQWYAMPPDGIKLPSSLLKIGTNAFAENGLEGEIIIPEGCLDIGHAAFSGANATKLSLPSRLERINTESFCNMHLLTQVVIPKYVNYIGNRAFSNDNALQTIICLNPEPPTLDGNPFSGLYFDKVVLEVPEQSVEIYRHTDGWNQFQNITAYHELAFNVPEIICMEKGAVRQGILRAEGDWEVSDCPDWVTVTPASGSYKEELTVTVSSGNENREGRIVFRLKGKDYTTYTDVRQVVSTDYREDDTVVLQEATAGQTPIPLFIVGEGYGADDIVSGQYLKDMKEQMEHLFSIEPYKTYRHYFTVSTAYACSPQAGMGGLTKFNGSDNAVWQYTHNHGSAVRDSRHTSVLVLCNTNAYGNRTYLADDGFNVSWLGKNTDVYPYDQRGDVLHYLGGRGFGKLGPEYVNHFTFMKACGCPGCNMTNEYNWARSKGWWQNVSITPKMTELPWYHLIFDERYAGQVDVYEGALNHARSTYRSENQSVMGAAHVYYYNTISREEIVRRIMEAAGETFTLEKFYENDKMEIPE